ncbi:type II toxin-antitoxin system RelE/ParE family toxin [Persicitalea sp.]|uniref:type II toxin-antitoxin system RelE family toxin n=1 Tax=Persicitalea sp. TaxID=3100273 RepID=UPI003593AAB0
MSFKIAFKKSAEKELSKLPAHIGKRVNLAIKQLSENPRPLGYSQLNEFYMPSVKSKVLYRIRIGDYRVVYSIEDEIVTVTIVKIDHRRKVYKNRG